MPTPFTHLYIAERLLNDGLVPSAIHHILKLYPSAFLLGGVVADAKPSPSSGRDVTHFYHYAKPMPDNPWREMFRQHPALNHPESQAHRAFLLGYVAHLATDEYWSRTVLKTYFAEGEWGKDMRDRFYVLHLLLIHMDERDQQRLWGDSAMQLRRCEPHQWLPFMSDSVIMAWRDFIALQLDSTSQTLQIFGERIATSPDELRVMLDDASFMQTRLWQHISPVLLATLEDTLYDFTRAQMLVYFEEMLQLS